MIMRHAFVRGPRLRAALHLAAVLSMLAGLALVAPQSVSAAKKAPSRSATHKKPAGATHKKPAGKVNINTAPIMDLEELPGVGTLMAQKIIAGRPYQSVQELRRAGIPPATVRGLLGVVTTGRAAETPRASTARAPEARVAAAGGTRREAPSAKNSPAQRTFFGIPIGRPRQPAPKAEPATAARGDDHARPTSAPRAEASARATTQESPAEGMVWADPDLKAYFHKGDHRYGTTRHGRFVWEDQAVREGYRAPKVVPKR